jgi:hypothetical protein
VRPEPDDPDALVFVSTDEGDGSTPLTNWDRATKIVKADSGTSA